MMTYIDYVEIDGAAWLAGLQRGRFEFTNTVGCAAWLSRLQTGRFECTNTVGWCSMASWTSER